MKNNRLLYVLIIILTIWCIVLTSLLTNKQDNSSTEVVNEYNISGFSTDFTKVVDEQKDSIVTISCSGNTATGFVYKQVDNTIYILTAYHAVSDSNAINVNFINSFSCSAELVGQSIYADIAVLKITSPYTVEPLELGDSTLLSSGEFIICLGTPSSIDYESSVELGMVSNDARCIANSITVDDTVNNYYLDVIQLSANLRPGYSGSPVLNMEGEVVGVNTMSLDSKFNFAITSNEVSIIADKIINGEKINKYQLGIKETYVNKMPLFERSSLNLPVDVLSGLYVNNVIESSIAQSAGIKVGDVITSINGTKIENLNDYLNAVYVKTDAFEFEIIRNGEVSTLRVDLNA